MRDHGLFFLLTHNPPLNLRPSLSVGRRRSQQFEIVMQPLLTQRQASKMLALSERTIERLRVSGLGPKFVRCGRSIRYRVADLETWIASRIVGSTSEASTDR